MAYALSVMALDVLTIKDIDRSEQVQQALQMLMKNLLEAKPTWIGFSLVLIVAITMPHSNSSFSSWILELLEIHADLLGADENRFALEFLWSKIVNMSRGILEPTDRLLEQIGAAAISLFKSGARFHLIMDYIGILEDIHKNGLSMENFRLESYVNERLKRLSKLFMPASPFILISNHSHEFEYLLPDRWAKSHIFMKMWLSSEVCQRKTQLRSLIIWGNNLYALEFPNYEASLSRKHVLEVLMDIVRVALLINQGPENNTKELTTDNLFGTLDQLKSFDSRDRVFFRRWLGILDRLLALQYRKLIDLIELVDILHEKACVNDELKRDNILIWLILQTFMREESLHILMKDIEGDEAIFRKFSHMWHDGRKDATHAKLIADIAFPAFCSRFGQNLKDRATLPQRHPATKSMFPIFHQVRTMREIPAQSTTHVAKGTYSSISSNVYRVILTLFDLSLICSRPDYS